MGDFPLAALILGGSYGTRLRPLTFTKPKCVVEFCNRPLLEKLLDALLSVGVTKIVIATAVPEHDIQSFMEGYSKSHEGVNLILSLEKERLGTAGPIAFAKEHLAGHRFFMLNVDVLSTFPFTELLAYHRAKGGEGTIMSYEVCDPTQYGIVLSDENGKILNFVEKPQHLSNCRAINTGQYIFEPSVIDRIKPVPTSLEREIFPKMAAEGQLYVMPLQGYWLNVSTPENFLQASSVVLGGKAVLIDESASIGNHCVIGQNVIIGKNVRIGSSCYLNNVVIFDGAVIGSGVCIDTCIIGWRSKIGNWARLAQMCVLGEDVTVKDKMVLNGVIVCPHRIIDHCYYSPDKVI